MSSLCSFCTVCVHVQEPSDLLLIDYALSQREGDSVFMMHVGPQQVPKTGRGYFDCSSALTAAGLGAPGQVDILVQEAADFVDGKGCKETY